MTSRGPSVEKREISKLSQYFAFFKCGLEEI